jgi:thiol-disulfide isomerase/thioredoxin
MKKKLCLIILGLAAASLANVISEAATVKSLPGPVTVEATYPGLASGALTFAALGQLPDGVLLRAGRVEITAGELQKKVDCASKQDREQYKKNLFFLLEQETTDRLLLNLARSEFGRTKTDCAGQTDQELIQKFVQGTVTAKVSVSEAEVADYYEKNKEMCGGATFAEAKDEVKEYAVQEKQQKAKRDYIRTLGQRVSIVVSAAWVKEQAKLARDNPVDKARVSGKPSVVDFGAVGCRPCDRLAPILKTLGKKYRGRANVLFVHIREQPILAARYGIECIPTQVFFDAAGKEVSRHLGYFPQDEIEMKLSQMGVK